MQTGSLVSYAENVDKALRCFNDLFMSILNTVALINEIKLKQRTETCIDSELLNPKKVRNKYLYQ